MRNHNKMQFIGILGRDPEMRFTPSGAPVTNFSVAVNDDYKNKEGETVKKTYWYKVVAWNKLAEICNQYLKKGSKVFVEGKLVLTEDGEPKTWQNKDGEWHSSVEVQAFELEMLGGGGEKADSGPDILTSSVWLNVSSRLLPTL